MQKDSLYAPAAHHSEAGAGAEWFFVPSASPVMRVLENIVESVADTATPVLILGESGSGKRALARQIHRLSPRANDPFTEVECADLPQDFFQRAADKDSGWTQALSQGTLFLAEIGDLPASAQPRLLHTCFNGSPAPGARMIASSKHNLEQEIRAARFREDLYYRISGVCLRVPPLRHRKEDIPILTDHFVEHYSRLFGRAQPHLSPQVVRYFQEYNWPGNVRELENALKTIVAVGDERVALAALRSLGMDPRRRNGDAENLSLKQAARVASRQAERELILKVLSRTRWNRKRAAQELQISYKALLYKLKQIGLEDELLGSEETL